MPTRAPSACRRPGCPGLVRNGVCSRCGPLRKMAAAARERELQTQIAGLQRDLGRVEGELQSIKARRPWWRFWQQQPQG